MRTTLNIDDELLGRASQLTGVKEKTSLVRLGLEALISLASARRLSKLGGTEKQLRRTKRRRFCRLMVLVDTSVWVDHFRRGNPTLTGMLEEGGVVCHPFVIGELSCGNLRNRDEILRLLSELASAPAAENSEASPFPHG